MRGATNVLDLLSDTLRWPMTEPYPELERCLHCRALSPLKGGEWPLYLNYTLKADTEELVSVEGPLCSWACAQVVAKRPALWADNFPEPETAEEVEV